MPRFTSKPTGPAQGTMNIRDDGRRRWGNPALRRDHGHRPGTASGHREGGSKAHGLARRKESEGQVADSNQHPPPDTLNWGHRTTRQPHRRRSESDQRQGQRHTFRGSVRRRRTNHHTPGGRIESFVFRLFRASEGAGDPEIRAVRWLGRATGLCQAARGSTGA